MNWTLVVLTLIGACAAVVLVRLVPARDRLEAFKALLRQRRGR